MHRQNIKSLFNEDGAVMVEFTLILPFFVIMMLLIIICYNVVHGKVELQVAAFSAMRRESNLINRPSAHRSQDVQFVKATEQRIVAVPGRMPEFLLGTYFIPIEASVCSYAGVMKGIGMNRYQRPPLGDRYYDAPELYGSGLCR